MVRRQEKSGEFYLPMLDIHGYAPGHMLIDYGFVDDIKQHVKDALVQSYVENGCDLELAEIAAFQKLRILDNAPDLNGICHSFTTLSGVQRHHLFYKKQDHPGHERFVRAHEETHALHGMGQLSLLDHKLKEIGLEFDWKRFFDGYQCSKPEREIVAHIGGLYAVRGNICGFPYTLSMVTEFDIAEIAYKEASLRAEFNQRLCLERPAGVSEKPHKKTR
ncbi:hypothetical protein HY501_03600 [Candidatus Woesearchaeota archaeon]|nr:hypothetical protein [Candidatus Woesearchaeota archaeon]